MSVQKDIADGKKAENRVKTILEAQGYNCVFNEDTKKRSFYDLILGDKTIEVKDDIYSGKSGNVAIEFYNSKTDKPSGINITKADIWCHIICGEPQVVTTKALKSFMKKTVPKRTIIGAGDGNADIKLYEIKDIIGIFKPISKIGELL